ncbi:restriction endonuclease subunit S [Methanococcoides sp. SA1]|nr:restriction endonuclease subunit S [Methanococcoides sp. SA1]
MSWPIVEIKTFLNERKDRFKPDVANSMGLKRIEKIDFSGNIHISDSKPTKTNMIRIKKGDLVISGINAEKGAVSIYDGDEDLLATIHYSSYHYDETKINVEYLRLFLRSSLFTKLLVEQTGGGIKTEIKPKKLLPLKISLPDLKIQIGIAAKFAKISEDLEALKCTNIENGNLVEELRQTILQLAVQGKLVEQNPDDETAEVLLENIQVEKERLVKEGKIKKSRPLSLIEENEIPYNIPNEWKWVRLGTSMIKITDGTHHSPTNIPTGDFKYISAKNIKNEGINLSNITFVTSEVHNEIYSRCNPEFGDILYIKDGATTGIVTINNLEEPFSMLSSVALLKLPSQIDNRYLLYLLRSPYFYSMMREDMTGVAITRVTLTKINNAIIPLPPLEEQKRIVAKVDQLMALCDQLDEKIRQTQSDSNILMEAAVNDILEV